MSRIPLVLLPGTLCSALLWEEQVTALSDIADIQVIDTSQHDNLGDLAHHIHTVMPDSFAVAGLSYGGIVAFEVWRHNPEVITHLGLLNTTPAPVAPERRAAQEKAVELALSGGFDKVKADQIKNVMRPSDYGKNLNLQSAIATMADEIGVDGFVRQIKAQTRRPDSRPNLAHIECQTLVLTGDEDQLCPPAIHQEMAEKIPNSTLHIISNCGHLSTMEHPEEVSKIMRAWLLS